MIPLLLTLSLAQLPAISISADAASPTISVSKSLFGIFFEEINQAGEGGVYSELLMNRGFELSGSGDHRGWKLSDGATRTTSTQLNSVRAASLSIPSGASAVNDGFWGIPLRRQAKYRLDLWVRGSAPLEVVLQDNARTLASATIEPTSQWSKQTVELSPRDGTTKGSLVLRSAGPGETIVGYVSLKPKSSDNGRRSDLSNLIREMRPSFIRFPGGCFIEGNDLGQRWNWKDSLGSIELRKGMGQSLWGYPISNGMGFHEYLQWCEDLGAEGLFVANCGMSHSQNAPMAEMGSFVQDVVDAIEYANGPATSKWGAMRARNGHPKPFNLRYVQIGNENGGPAYNERYELMAKAINAKDPNVRVVANVWGGVPSSYKLDIIDEHYYMTPHWFWANANRYNSYDRKGPKIYVGEYAVTQGSGRGNLAGALGEAAFMTGLERNADIVQMATYAPLFENVNNRQWNPNAINFDNSRSFGTPSYWVQALFGQNKVDRIVSHSFTAPMRAFEPVGGGVGLLTWRTEAEFKDIEITADGKKLPTPTQLERSSGNWTIQNGVIRQTALQDDRRTHFTGVSTGGAKRVSMSLKARKLRGAEGFIILLEVGPTRTIQWNLGGWENTVHAFQMNGGRFGKGVPGRIEADRWYDIRIEQDERSVRGYLDGKLIEEAQIEAAPDFAAVAGIVDKTNELVLKVVNGASTSRTVALALKGVPRRAEAQIVTLAGSSLTDENSFENPNKVAPRRTKSVIDTTGKLTFPPYSLTILRIRR